MNEDKKKGIRKKKKEKTITKALKRSLFTPHTTTPVPHPLPSMRPPNLNRPKRRKQTKTKEKQNQRKRKGQLCD